MHSEHSSRSSSTRTMKPPRNATVAACGHISTSAMSKFGYDYGNCKGIRKLELYHLLLLTTHPISTNNLKVKTSTHFLQVFFVLSLGLIIRYSFSLSRSSRVLPFMEQYAIPVRTCETPTPSPLKFPPFI